MMKIDYTFHSHTYRCGHAVGDIEDYVTTAIEHGYKIYGVSDHVFLPGITNEPHIRGDYSLLNQYIETFQISKEKHKNDIEMYLGFECEYCDRFKDYYFSLLKEKDFDYLIFGQHHYYETDGRRTFYTYPEEEGSVRDIALFGKDIIEAMKSGLFLYIAHPDIFFCQTAVLTPIHEKITREIIEASIKYDVPLEINIHGFMRNKRVKIHMDYPCDYFWEQVSKSKAKVVCGGDFHNTNEIDNREYLDYFDDLVNKYKIKLTDIREVYKNYKKRLVIILNK